MNLAMLRTFLAIVESGSLVGASQTLNVTQSTVTTRLKSLEAELGQTLVYRQKTGILLTSSGFKFKRYAEAMTDLWRQAKRETSLPDGMDTQCKLGCHMDLWPGLGRRLFDEIRRTHPTTAFSAWPGEHAELDRWLGTGLVDVALTYRPSSQERHTIHALPVERLILFSTRQGSPIRFDPGYVYVDMGDEFGRRHAEVYADAGIPRFNFGSAVWALDHLLDHGGSAYLPERMAEPHLLAGKLFPVPDAPMFTRNVYLIANDAAASSWSWLPDLIGRI